MRYSEFKPINEGFWDSILDITTGGTTAQVAQKKWIESFSQKLSTALDTAIRGGNVNPSVPGTIDPSTKKTTNTTPNRNFSSIAEYVYSYIQNAYRDSRFDEKTLNLLINAINQVENDYSKDRGKNAIKKAGEIISAHALSGNKTPDNTPQQISSDNAFPTKTIKNMKAQVGDKIMSFNFDVKSGKWTDSNNAPITDLKSILALNGIAKTLTKPAPSAKPTPAPSTIIVPQNVGGGPRPRTP